MYLLFIFMLCSCESIITVEINVTNFDLNPSDPFPDYWDWRDLQMVSPVKDQGTCSACWAFSAVANIESHLKIHLEQEVILSEQFLIDCIPDSVGCGSTSLLKTFANIVSVIGGVLKEKDYYPYSSQPEQCRWNKQIQPVPVIGYRRVKNDELNMVQMLYKFGPLSAGINSASMREYTSGIDEPSDEKCPPNKRDHAVLIVGYNSYVNKITGIRKDYWIIKNSWGTMWGDKGFYYLVRGNNACGIAEDVSFSILN